MKRKLDVFNLEDKPEEVANIIRTKFIQIEQKLKQNNVIKSLVINNPNINTTKSDNDKKFMKNIISILDELNIITFEYIPHHSKRDKINFNGCYIKPNLIVIKKESKNYNRKQIFTLLHELGHHLLDCEDIDNVVDEDIVSDNKIENWCNQFAFSFLNNSLQINLKNIQEVYEKTYLSYSSVYTHLKDNRIITFQQYKSKLNEISSNIAFKKKKEEQERESKIRNEMSAKGIDLSEENIKKYRRENFFVPPQKPVYSNLFKDLVEVNFLNGNIRDFEFERLIKQR